MTLLGVLLVPAGALFTAGLTLLGRSLGRQRLRIGPAGVVVATSEPTPGDRLRLLAPMVAGLTMVAAGLLLKDKGLHPVRLHHRRLHQQFHGVPPGR